MLFDHDTIMIDVDGPSSQFEGWKLEISFAILLYNTLYTEC